MLALGGIGPLSLHAADVPVRALGLGSRRLVALALQWMAVTEGAIVLVDEVEHGLEPHRLRHLLRVLKAAPKDGRGQVIFTTHSSVAVEEMAADQLIAVRCDGGLTHARRLPAALQAVVRRSAEAFLGRNVLVCEGKTEVGLCRDLMRAWAEERKGVPVAQTGTAFAVGGGDEAPSCARDVAALGYRTALFADSDKPLDPDPETLAAAGVHVIRWADGASTEQRVALDIPAEALQGLLDLMVELNGADSTLAAVEKNLPTANGASIAGWQSDGLSEKDIRDALGIAANKTKVFKQADPGEQLGAFVARYLPQMKGTDLREKLAEVAAWCYDG